MDNSLVVALGISVIGMTLLFLALALFYGLLSLMMTVFGDRSPEPETGAKEEAGASKKESAIGSDHALRAAAIAVALARAQVRTPRNAQGSTTDSLSPWWSLHHQREVTRSPNAGRVP